MDELITWLRGVLDEDERLAREATHYNMITIESRSRSEEDHARRHDPESVLADIAAKRAILDARGSDAFQAAAVTLTDAGWDGVPADALDAAWLYLVRLLASAYAGRPGYRRDRQPGVDGAATTSSHI